MKRLMSVSVPDGYPYFVVGYPTQTAVETQHRIQKDILSGTDWVRDETSQLSAVEVATVLTGTDEYVVTHSLGSARYLGRLKCHRHNSQRILRAGCRLWTCLATSS